MARPHPTARDRAEITPDPAPITAELAGDVANRDRVLITITGTRGLCDLTLHRLRHVFSHVDADQPEDTGMAGLAITWATCTL
ncbi:hypothetical protein [Phaeacidiphilus oryzae]|uniref:hypothetical protein n=1 Tax=Phaeacidiphilus oryzae TaxID=348818 RepID=UPI000569CCB4|nr:hypothetical protein [Phaeacidiphilus oryzae]